MSDPSGVDGKRDAVENAGAGEEPRFDLAFDAPAGQLLRVSPLVRRLVAPNPGPFTFTGTCSYVVGEGEVGGDGLVEILLDADVLESGGTEGGRRREDAAGHGLGEERAG